MKPSKKPTTKIINPQLSIQSDTDRAARRETIYKRKLASQKRTLTEDLLSIIAAAQGVKRRIY